MLAKLEFAMHTYQIPVNREYFERYLHVFENGVFYVERDELVAQGRKCPRAYFAGGIDLRSLRWAMGTVVNRTMVHHSCARAVTEPPLQMSTVNEASP